MEKYTTVPLPDRSSITGNACFMLLMIVAAIEPVSAGGTESRRGSILEDILVTAQRREESIRDVPIAMQAFTAETLKQLGVVDTRDLANIIPGFSYADSGLDNPIYTLRGVGFDDFSRTANSAVGVYIDEVSIAYPYMTQGADVDMARIEVLKGPQGTLYGRNTTGGAINYIANKPTDSREFGVEAEYGRFETISLEGYVSGPLTNRLRGRLALRHIESGEGWQKSLTRRDDRLGQKDKQAGRATLEWDPIDSLRLNFSLDWWRDRSDPQAPQATALSPQNPEFSEDQLHPEVRDHPLAERDDNRPADWVPDIPWRLNNEFIMPAFRGYWDVSDYVSLVLIAAYTDFETDTSWLPWSGLSVVNNEVRRSTEASARSIEVRADGQFPDDRLSWLLGLYTSKDSVKDRPENFFDTSSATLNNVMPGVIPIANRTRSVHEQDARSDAVFFNVEYGLTNSLELSLGLRYTDEVRKYFACPHEHPDNQGIGITPVANGISLTRGGSGDAQLGDCYALDRETRNPGPVNLKLKEDNVGGKAAISWTPGDSYLFYISYSRGFKSGSFLAFTVLEEEQYDPVTQERVDSFEIGGKTSWLSDALRIDFAAFDYDYKDKQLLSYFIDDVFGRVEKLFNVPKSTVRGAELEIQSSPWPGLSVSAVASYLDTEIGRFVGVTSDAEENVDFSGNRLPYTPKRSFALLADYRFPLPFWTGLEGNVGIDYSYNSATTSSIENTPVFDVPSYELMNLRFGVGDTTGRWNVMAWVRNVTDEFYQLNVPETTAETIGRFTGMPRTYGVRVSYRYF